MGVGAQGCPGSRPLYYVRTQIYLSPLVSLGLLIGRALVYVLRSRLTHCHHTDIRNVECGRLSQACRTVSRQLLE